MTAIKEWGYEFSFPGKSLSGMDPDLCVALFTHPSYEMPSLSLPKSISPSSPPSCSVPLSHIEIDRLINAAAPLSNSLFSFFFFPSFHPSLTYLPHSFSAHSPSLSWGPFWILDNPTISSALQMICCAAFTRALSFSLCWWMVIWHHIKISW